jgi:hypothetical protein
MIYEARKKMPCLHFALDRLRKDYGFPANPQA